MHNAELEAAFGDGCFYQTSDGGPDVNFKEEYRLDLEDENYLIGRFLIGHSCDSNTGFRRHIFRYYVWAVTQDLAAADPEKVFSEIRERVVQYYSE